jgi:hypothetical protein
MKDLIQFAQAFGIPCQDPETAQAIYLEQLGKLPGDLLTLAISRVKASWTWGNRMPFPAEILNLVRVEHFKLAMLLSRAQVAHMKANPPEPERPQLTPEQIAKAQKYINDATRKVTKAPAKDPEDMTPEQAARQLDKDRLEFNKALLVAVSGEN